MPGKRNAARRNKRHIRRRRGAAAQQTQIMSLQRQLTRLDTKVRKRAQFAQYAGTLSNDDYNIELPNGDFSIHPLISPKDWNPMFQAPPDTGATPILGLEPNKCQLVNMDLQLLFSPKNSETPFTPRILKVWVLKLRPETAQYTLDATTDMTNLPGDVSGGLVHVTDSNGGLPTLIKLNPAAFKIMRYRSFLMGNILNETDVEPAQDNQVSANLSDPIKRCRFRIKVRNNLKPPVGSWRAMEAKDIMPLDRYYLITHVGGWGGPDVDGDNAVHMDTNLTTTVRFTN